MLTSSKRRGRTWPGPRSSAAVRLALGVAAAAGAAGLSACGTQGISLAQNSPYHRGAVLFQEHCSGCHTLSVVGAEGSASTVRDRLRNQGPDFDVRKETVQTVLYAIRNGGFTGQIMPQNIVVGSEAQAVAQFLARYAGTQAEKVPSVEVSLPGASSATTGASGATGTAPAGAASASAPAPGAHARRARK